MEPRQTILLFGDLATDVSSSIDHVIEQSKRSNSLGRFLQEANNTLRDELVHLTEAERAIFTSAASIEEMAEEYAEKEDRTGLGHNFLLCVTRLGELILAEDFHTTVPDNRFDINFWCDKTKLSKNASSVPYGCFLDRPGAFDNRFFSISPREAMQMDPTQRLMLMASYEALEMAGYSQERSSSGPAQRITTFLGQTTDDWRDINHQEGVDIYYVPATQRSFGPGRIHHHFKWEGPTYRVDSACASSATAVSLAYSALVNRDADMALAGGGAIIASPMPLAGVGRGGFLSETGACKPFRADADGYCRGEGVGVIILKRLEDAVAAKDNIMAVIGGAARNHSALASSITHPHAGAQQRLYRQVLRQANIKATEVGYVEMHGTGTQAGDVCEMSSVVEVFAKGRTEANPLILGAVKACVGHSEAAAGITGLIKALMVLRDGEVPPQPGLPSVPLNPAFPPLHNMNVRVADRRMQLRAPATGDGKRRLLVNNFDAAGGNTCFVLEEAPSTIQPAGKDPRTHHVVACSAHCAKSLRGNQQQLLDYLNSHPGTRLCDLAYTTAARRMHHQFRSACMAESVEDVSNFLQTELAERSEQKRADGGSKVPVGFVFTGQGAQYAGMGKQLFETSAQFRHTICSYQDICNTHGFPSFLEIITNSDVDMTSKTTVQTQLAIVALEIGLANLWKSWGVHPDWVIGHSLGEYAALHVAEVLSISDVLYLVGQRAMAVEEKCLRGTYSMLAVSSASEDTERIIAAESLNSFGSTLHGQIVSTGGVFSAAYLMRQAREAVNFIGALEDCKAIGLANDQAVWIEIGPSPVCLSMVGATLDVSVSNLLPTIKPRDSDWKTVSCSLAALYNFGLPIRWPKIHQEYLGALRFLSLPSYVFDPKDYWTTFAENPREIPSPTPVQLSSFIHRVEQESISNQDVSARFIAHVSEPQLLEAVRGHLIDGFPFCPSCVLWELAYAAAKHLYQKTHHGQKIPAMYIVDLEFPHPLVVSDGNNDLAIVMDASACSKNDWTTGIVFTTRTGADTHDLATCRVRFCAQAQQSQIEWNKLSFFITQRISYICASASTGQSGHFLRKRVLYRLFSNLVGYGQRFQGMEDVAVTDDLTEAVATAKLTPATGAGPFATGSSPY
ncbi:hypothetical protein MMC08_005264 [Neofusicoccum parvum]|uniref:Uncharacterized protein n=1 Tax=Neofusicoccum parvum TaxID=310453 RepID=A0ACB5SBX1_9PEZI|nr:hypothetical protein MMC08_005264 [Neofusicoccum parvum]